MEYSHDGDEGYVGLVEDYFELEWGFPEGGLSIRLYQGYDVAYIKDEISFFVYNPLYTFPRRLFDIENVLFLRHRLASLCDTASYVCDYPIIWVSELAKLFRREIVSITNFYYDVFRLSIENEIEHYKEEYNEMSTMRSLLRLIREDGHLETRLLVSYFALQKWLRILTFEYQSKFVDEFGFASTIKCTADWDEDYVALGDVQDEGIC